MAEWKVCRFINHTKKEVYHKHTNRVDKHYCVGRTLTLCHWDSENNDIDVDTLAEGLTQREASARAHKEEEEYCQRCPPGYTCIKIDAR